MENIMTQEFYGINDNQKSIPLLCSIGQAALHRQSHSVSWEYSLQLFTVLDEMMANLCKGSTGIAANDLRKWRKLRSKMTQESTRWSQTHLPPRYFNDIHPCPLLDES